jgi:hypothetical protein
LSAIETLAVRLLLVVGVNVTLTVQLAPAATLVPQVLVWLKLPLFVPVIVILVRFSVPVPVLDKVTACAALLVPNNWLLNVSEVGERLTAGATPVPVRLTAWGLPLALSVIVTAALRAPVAVGLNVTLMVQLAAAATLVPQVLVWLKSPLFVPVMAMLVMLSAAVPVFERVTACAVLLVLTNWLLNVSDAGDRPTAGATPVPVKLTV